MVNGPSYLDIVAVLRPLRNYKLIIVVRGLVPIDGAEAAGKLFCKLLPFFFFLRTFLTFTLEIVLSHGAVHIDLVHGGRDCENPSVFGKDRPSCRGLRALGPGRAEDVLYRRIDGVGKLDMDKFDDDGD